MEALAKAQLELGKTIEQNFANFKKDGKDRKTEEYVKQRLAVLDTNSKIFESNHKALCTFMETHGDHSYFAKNYFDQIKELITKHSDGPNEILKNLHSDAQHETGASGVARLLKQRKGLVAYARQLINDIEDRIKEEQSRQFLEFKLGLLTNQKRLLDENNQAIWEVYDGYGGSEDKMVYDEIDTNIQEAIVLMQEKLAHLQSSSTSATGTIETGIKLPKISVPTFDGSYLKWTQFKELFTQLVDKQRISEVQKMYYLISNLSGEAHGLIQHLPASGQNYKAAWDILKQRYDNKRLLVASFLNKLMNHPSAQTESAQTIKRLHDVTKECIMSLETLGVQIQHWDPILVYIISKKLDKTTYSLYEQSLVNPRALETMTHLLSFLEIRFQSLETLNHRVMEKIGKPTKGRASTLLTSSDNLMCYVCKQSHHLFSCKEFRDKSAQQRLEVVNKNQLCRNCLKPGHRASTCTAGVCMKCKSKHNTLLHRDLEEKKSEKEAFNKPRTEASSSGIKTALMTQTASNGGAYVLLGTIEVVVSTSNGQNINCRAVLDSGSQINCITEKLAKKLQIKGVVCPINIQGVGRTTDTAAKRTSICIRSKERTYAVQLEAFILSQITTNQPSRYLDTSTWGIPANVKLADPHFSKPGSIDILIGAEHYYDIVKGERINLGKGLPILQSTTFGWVIGGRISHQQERDTASCYICTQESVDINAQIERFWQLETIEDSPSQTTEERKCERFFKETTKRTASGRFVVRLPFSEDPSTLGESKELALCRFASIERKLLKSPSLKEEYCDFMRNYASLGHMTEINVKRISGPHCFLPHHSVIKPDSDTTKLRVVFDASAKTSTNISLNDILHTGPKIQEDIMSVLLRFRMTRYVCTADIEKMYRQVQVADEDRKFQMIMWRENPQDVLRYFQLNTVTYGMTSAPYLAIKCLHTLAESFERQNPLGAEAIKENMYVDDAMFGADSIIELLEKQKQIVEILASGGFKLRKWCSNHEAPTKNIPMEDRAVKFELSDNKEHEVKALGLAWLPQVDEFRITLSYNEVERYTKRKILSDIAHIFDPLGLLGPVTVMAKLILQKLWDLKLDWDDVVPDNLQYEWAQFSRSLKALDTIRIQRHIAAHRVARTKEMHVFCDASEKAYGAAIYIRTTAADGTIVVRLLCAKSRIAPLKPTTVPRLELCAAKLGCSLMARVCKDLKWRERVCLWTDSEIVLAWLRTPASSMQKFVANRVAAIQEVAEANLWRHVPSKQNPADLISRGISPKKFNNCQQWFYGPLFLHGKETAWPKTEISLDVTLEMRQPKVALPITLKNPFFVDSLTHLSSIIRIKRTVAFCLQFINNVSNKSLIARKGELTVLELEEAMETILREVQATAFSKEIKDLLTHKGVDSRSAISSLTPFLDERNLIRVGGRLDNADLSYEAKHPILLPKQHDITKMIMKRIHMENSHVGPQALIAITRQRYWPLNGKTIARSIVQNCVLCSRLKPKLFEQIMGDLPKDRVQPARPFLKTGVDFCGPFYVRLEIRGKAPQKAYIAVFCCFATKAVHLEVVKNLTTEAFIMALRRFTSRRGYCETIYCDNATNFIGANNKLNEITNTLYSNEAAQTITNFAAERRINFKFIPPRTPHFGGLWEAAVKSAKELFYKTVSGPITYEELTTITADIEALLNSRPLIPVSNDPNDLSALTPGHFLIGGPLNASIDPHAQPLGQSLVETSKELKRIKNDFWQRWSKEYLSELQQRNKWRSPTENVKPGTMVVIKEDNSHPYSWPLARVLNTFKGKDGKVRVVEVKTVTGVFKRPIQKLAPLPVDIHSNIMANETLNDTIAEPTVEKHPTLSTLKKQKRVPSLLSTLLVLCLILPIQGTTEVKITPFKTQPGIYFEKLGSASLITDEWNMIAYYDMKPYWTECDLVTNGTDQLKKFCNRLIDHTACLETIDHFMTTLIELNNNNKLLNQVPPSRTKRSPLDIVGNVANSLFGVLDSRYAEKMSNIINELNTNDNHLLDLIKNQTSIIDSTTNLIQKSTETTSRQLQQFYLYLNTTMDAVNQINRAADNQKILEIFNSLSIRLILAISNLQRIQALLINVLTDTQHGKVNPMLVSPTQLQQQLQLVKEHVPSHLRPPSATDNLIRIYGLLSIEGRAVPNQIIFRIRIPLFAGMKYELLSVIPVPIIKDETVLIVNPTAPYALTNLRRDQYYPINEQNLMSLCSTFGNSNWICKLGRSVKKFTGNEHVCELSILFHSTNLSTCTFTNADRIQRWTQLSTSNSWIYALKEATTISVICEKRFSQHNIQGVGTITVPSGCSIKDDKTTLEASHYTNSVDAVVMSIADITPGIPNSIQNKNHWLQPDFNISLSKDIARIKGEINMLTHQSTLSRQSITHHDVHQYGVSYAALALIGIILGCYAIRRLISSRRQQQAVPQRQPDNQAELNLTDEFSVNV